MRLIEAPQDPFRIFLSLLILMSELIWSLSALTPDDSSPFIQPFVLLVLVLSMLSFPIGIVLYILSRWTYKSYRDKYPHGKIWVASLIMAFVWPLMILAVQ